MGLFLRLCSLVVLGFLGPNALSAAQMGEADARHFLERTGFGAPPAQVKIFAKLSREAAVDRLLNAPFHPVFPPPVLEYVRPAAGKDLSEQERKVFVRSQMEQGIALRGWWINEMLRANSPGDALRERMTLFWHNHFVSSQQKVKSLKLMLDQNLLLRQYALGNFGVLLHKVSKDPAMILYLDGASNRKGSPNENFAREVMELFTLGEGHYSEQDIKEAARAFTGWSLDRQDGGFLWRPMLHDEGEKQILGRKGAFDGDQVLDILLSQPRAAEYVTSKLWREFVSPEPDAAEVRRIAADFRSSGYESIAALRSLLLNKHFWAQENRGALVKSPVDLLVGTMRTLEVQLGDTQIVVHGLRQLGQDLFSPPNVKGWPGGEAWINSNTLLIRKQFLERLLRAEELALARANTPMANFGRRAEMELRLDTQGWLKHYDQDRRRVIVALLAIPPAEAIGGDVAGVALLKRLLLDPVFQLK